MGNLWREPYGAEFDANALTGRYIDAATNQGGAAAQNALGVCRPAITPDNLVKDKPISVCAKCRHEGAISAAPDCLVSIKGYDPVTGWRYFNPCSEVNADGKCAKFEEKPPPEPEPPVDEALREGFEIKRICPEPQHPELDPVAEEALILARFGFDRLFWRLYWKTD